mmetsp:Transcript_10684/g.32708  ORF Transcript_10684/g.32708 Transcript_10684/m.32708 type:complete len:710 (+) Transcript_10684:107-2236(+)|eukprot:CAMPEP_0198731806 /NCGR_PEP_ID=MMETSP1475-20131203/32227_1 /TAXON_ID= ORGANISM="Unidentified sp., Strain CCMP1999" /NCGR_SAMPLE_ID=MMETSP1475 /ASSEMBLY_ACC=CAM_ASM_001111 /LENGTH=709 /DNA_ID=CAMNT_0044494815 /DNA_START=73 /DNA_END=2202 /DNA_ORIENTATION=+
MAVGFAAAAGVMVQTHRGVGGSNACCTRFRRQMATRTACMDVDLGTPAPGANLPYEEQMRQLVRAVKDKDEVFALDMLEEILRSKHSPLDVKFYNKMLGLFGEAFGSRAAENIYEGFADRSIRPSVQTFGILMKLMVADHRFAEVEQLFVEIKKQGLQPNRSAFNSLITARGKAGDVEGAQRAFQELRDLRIHPNNVTFNSLLGIFRDARYVRKMQDYFVMMPRFGLEPDVFTYSIILDALGKMGQVKAALGAFRDMKSRGIAPNEVTYNTLLKMYAEREDMAGVEKILTEMSDANLEKTQSTYDVLVGAYARDGNMEKLGQVLAEVKRERGKLSESTYGVLLRWFASRGDVKRVEGILSEMKALKRHPSEKTYNNIILGFGEAKLPAAAMAVYSDMKAAMIAPSEQTFNALLRVCASDGDISRMKRLLQEMDELQIDRSRWTHSIVIDVLVRENDIGGAESELSALMKGTQKLDAAVFNPLLRHYATHARMDKVQKLFARMKQEGTGMTERTYNIVLDAMARSGNVRGAQQTVNDMIKAGIEPSEVTYTTLMKLYSVANDLARVKSTFAKIQNPNAQAYVVLLQALGRAGKVDEIIDSFDKITVKRIKRSTMVYTSLVTALVRAGDVDEAVVAFRELQDEEVRPNEVTYTALISALLQQNRGQGALRLAKEAERSGVKLDSVLLKRLQNAQVFEGKDAQNTAGDDQAD